MIYDDFSMKLVKMEGSWILWIMLLGLLIYCN